MGRLVWPAGVKDDGWCWVPGCAAEGMAVPLAVKDLRPLRGAFGVLDREPLARHRQMEGQARGLPQETPRSPLKRSGCLCHTCDTASAEVVPGAIDLLAAWR